MGHQNWLASLALIAWPFISLALFANLRLSQAILWTILGAELILPTGALFKIPMIPQLDKVSLPNLSLLLGCFLFAGRRLRMIGGMGMTELLIVLFVSSPLFTSQFNADPIFAGDTILPGVGLYDGISAVELALITALPFFVGRQFLRSAEDNEDILRTLIVAGLIYSLPMLFEIRMSPNLQYWIYGFAATDFVMTYRSGGFRPMVFMGHGLIAAFFMMTTVIAAAALWRARVKHGRLPMGGVTAYLGAVLILCKSAGAALYALALIPIVRLTGPRLQMRLALVMACVALTYPMLRSFDLFPTNSLVSLAELIDHDRAQSLKFRFDNEDKLLARAFERPMFGWGRYGRNLVFGEENGRNESVTDGAWVIRIGQYGLMGFLSLFGLLSIPMFSAVTVVRYASSARELTLLGALSLIVAVNIVELIPNSALLPWTWLICGSLLGRAEALRAQARQKQRGRLPIGHSSSMLRPTSAGNFEKR